jgi:hypothetical protein
MRDMPDHAANTKVQGQSDPELESVADLSDNDSLREVLDDENQDLDESYHPSSPATSTTDGENR